jgi:hypothetical protein
MKYRKKPVTEVDKLHREMESLVRDELRGAIRNNTVVLSVPEMANVWINVLKGFMDMKKQKQLPIPNEGEKKT